MNAYTYTTLVTDLRSYLENVGEPKFDASQDSIIGLGERRLAREVDSPDQKATAPGTLTATAGYIITPLDFVSPLSLTMAVVFGTPPLPMLTLKDVGFLQEAYGVSPDGGGGAPGVPRFYAISRADFNPEDVPILGSKLIIAPVGAIDYDYTLYYRKIPDSITSTYAKTHADYSTWLGTYYPQALLYACICEGYTFLKGEPAMMTQYEKLLISAVAETKMGMTDQRNDQFRKAS